MTQHFRQLALPLLFGSAALLGGSVFLGCIVERPYDGALEDPGALGPDGVTQREPAQPPEQESQPVGFEVAPSEPDGQLRKGFVFGSIGPAGEVADEAALYETTPWVDGAPVGFRLEAHAPGSLTADALIIFSLDDGYLEDLGGPGSRVDIQPGSGVRVWLCAVAPGGAMVFDDVNTAGTLDVRDAGSGLLEVVVSTTGEKGASAELVFSYEPDRDRLPRD